MQVRVANAGPFVCGCVRYINTEKQHHVPMIVAIVVLLGVPLILLIIVAVMLYVCKRCDGARETHVADNDDVEMSPVVAHLAER